MNDFANVKHIIFNQNLIQTFDCVRFFFYSLSLTLPNLHTMNIGMTNFSILIVLISVLKMITF